MTISRSVSVVLIASTLVAAVPKIGWAGDDVAPQTTINLRAAIDRAAAQSVTKSVSTAPLSKPAARARQSPGGGGGSSAMIWTLVGTISGLAATYFVVKEMQKQTDELEAAQQQR
jgi:hypothetical protein